MSLTERQAILGQLPDSALRIGTRLGIPPVDVHRFLEELRRAGHCIKVNARSYALA